MKTLLLDFNTIIDPISLLSCLITFRQTHDKIHVRAESLIYHWKYHDRKHDPLIHNFGNLRNKNALDLASWICKRSSDDLGLQQNNLCLALRLLHHAFDEGIISVLDATIMGEWAGPDKSVSREILYQTPSFEYVDRNLFDGAKYDCVTFAPETPQRYDDLAMSLKQYWDVTIGGRTFSPIDMITQSKSRPYDVGYQAEVVRVLNADSFNTYTTLIDNPKVLPLIAEAAKTICTDDNYKSKVRWFLPRYALSTLSMGTYPFIEMLWIIVKRQLDKARGKEDR